MQTPFSPLSFGKSFMKIRSAITENGCLIFLADGKSRKKTKKNKKTFVKHIRIRLIGVTQATSNTASGFLVIM